ncbi:MAG TPA: hypothetical protein VIW48_10345 [Nitrospiraceae bacterium]
MRQRSRVGMVCLGLVAIWWVGSTLAFAQGRLTDMLVSVVKDKVIAVTGVGQSEINLSVGETVRSTKAQGLTALAITSTRLLGFSSQLRHWGEQTLEADEHVNMSQVLREFCVVATDQHLYGFQETLAHWTSEALGGSERVQDVRAQGHVALVVTTERLVGFSAFTSGFHAIALQGDERVQGIEHTGDALLVKTSSRTLIFRSRMASWTEES